MSQDSGSQQAELGGAVRARATDRPNHYALFAAAAVLGTVSDLATKWLAFTRIGDPELHPGANKVLWQGVFSFRTSYNHGALWGILRNFNWANGMFAALSLAAAAAILFWVFRHGATRDRLLAASLGLILAGTIGNCYDRIVWGKVRDFLYFELINWPIFNLADSCLVCGAFLLMIQAFFSELPLGHSHELSPAASAPAAAPVDAVQP